MAIILAAEAVHVPAHLMPPGSPQAKQLHHPQTQPSLGQSCHRQKNSCICVYRVTSVVSDSLQPCRLWPARLLCQGGGSSRQEYWSILANTGCHTLLEHLFPAALATNSPEYLVLPEPLQPKQLHHLHTWPSQGQTQVLQGSLRSKPSARPICRGGYKTTIETRGSVAKEEDLKPSHQLCKLQIKST